MNTDARRCAVAVAVALPVFLIGCTFGVGGLAKDEWRGDVGHYQYLGQRVLDGDVPYHDFYVEYPPGAPWVLLGRNVLLVAVFFVLLAELRSSVVTSAFVVPREPAALGVRPAGQG